VASVDGCRIFVTTQNTPAPGGLALIEFKDGNFAVTKTASLTIQPAGITLSQDGKLVVAAGADGIAFVDAQTFAVLGTLDDGGKGPIMARISADDKTLFVSDEFGSTVTVIDLVKARANGFKADAITGKISTGIQPVGLALSPDQKILYAAIEISKTGEAVCQDGARAGGTAPPPYPEGNLTIIDVATKKVIAELPSGCRPIRVALSPDGKRAFISARGTSEIVGFDTEKKTRLGAVKLPTASFGIAVSADGSTLYTASGATITLIDTATVAVKGTIATGGAARDLTLQKDGRTLLVTNGAASALEIVQLP
jgi:DNA-binding beta-propeller fold protein YncE